MLETSTFESTITRPGNPLFAFLGAYLNHDVPLAEMGNRLSRSSASVQVCAAVNQPVICPSSNSTPGNGYPSIGGFKSDPDIAGIGVCAPGCTSPRTRLICIRCVMHS